ncbi:MAG: hypothetical protein M1356_09445, partial [Gammaproteobacteria bacterium]|nr:hypothetical protein [Gammaproteobacteria bacterium]
LFTTKRLALVTAITAAVVVPSASASMAGVEAAASGFSSQFNSTAAVIGGAIITAAFGALIWKWIKGMIFS